MKVSDHLCTTAAQLTASNRVFILVVLRTAWQAYAHKFGNSMTPFFCHPGKSTLCALPGGVE